jgi:hypothetical protein
MYGYNGGGGEHGALRMGEHGRWSRLAWCRVCDWAPAKKEKTLKGKIEDDM